MLCDQVADLLCDVLRDHNDANVITLQHLGETLLNLRKGSVLRNDHEISLALLVTFADAGEEEAGDSSLVSDDSNEETTLDPESLAFL